MVTMLGVIEVSRKLRVLTAEANKKITEVENLLVGQGHDIRATTLLEGDTYLQFRGRLILCNDEKETPWDVTTLETKVKIVQQLDALMEAYHRAVLNEIQRAEAVQTRTQASRG